MSIYGMVRRFNREQDEIYVEMKEYMDPDSPIESLPLERVMADIIAGDRSDLYYTGMLDFSSDTLRNAGLIQDWKPVLEADPALRPEDYMTHIWKLLEQPNGVLYDLCVSFSLNAPASGFKTQLDGRTAWTYDEFLAYLADSSSFSVTQDYLLTWYQCGFYDDWIDTNTMTCDFTSETFYDWLDFISALPVQIETGKRLLGIGLSGVKGHKQNYDMYGDWCRYLAYPSRYAHTPAFIPNVAFALSSTTVQTEACMTFLKWMLSEDIQMDYYGDANRGFPVNQATWETLLDRAQLPGDHENALFQQGMPEEEAAYLRQLIAGIDHRHNDWLDAYTIFTDEVRAFLAGDISAETCAERLQSRFTVLLAEQK